MRTWGFLLGPLVVWALHFFLVYAIGSIFPGLPIARWLTIAATFAGLAGAGSLFWLAMRQRRSAHDDQLKKWAAGVGAIGSGLALIAVFYQGLPAVLT